MIALPIIPVDGLSSERMTVTVNITLMAWVRAEAEKHAVSPGEIIRACIFIARESDKHGGALSLLSGKYRLRSMPSTVEFSPAKVEGSAQ